MKHYYETSHQEPGQHHPTVTAHDNLDAAITYANTHNINIIYEIGGAWDEYGRCWFCGEWFSLCQLNNRNECERCEIALIQHGG